MEPISTLLVGMHDYDTGLDMDSFRVTADFSIDGAPAGENLATKFERLPGSRWQLTLKAPVARLAAGMLNVSVADRQGNQSRIERRFSVTPKSN
jgi:hypothetical protein